MNTQWIYGIHAVEAALEWGSGIERLLVQQGGSEKRLSRLIELARAKSISIERVSPQELTQLTQAKVHQGVAVLCREVVRWDEGDLLPLVEAATQPLVLILDGVTDPHNLGACLRSANAAGATVVIAPKDKAVGLTPVVRKVACGAAEATPFIQVTNLSRAMQQLKELGVWLYGASDQAEVSIYDTDLNRSVGLVLGAEGKGLRRLTMAQCDDLMSIPMAGSVSSLNVSVAAGVCLFEVVRRQRGDRR